MCKVENYIKKMKATHEAFENYGLDFDYKNYVQFNKEKLIRQFVGFERLIQRKMFEVHGLPFEFDESEPTEAERFYAQCKILVFVEMGLLNKENLEPVGKMEVLV